MISWIIFGIGLLIAVFSIIAKREEIDDEPSKIIRPIAAFVLVSLIAWFQPYTLDRVDAGYRGIKVKLTGDNRGVSNYHYATGWVLYNSWVEQMLEFPTYQQHIEYDSTVVITKGGFSAVIKPTFNYSLLPGSIGPMFVDLRKSISEIEQGWLKTAIIGAVADVSNKWKVDDIFNNREQFENAIMTEANKRNSKYFNISQLRTNIIPPKSLQSAIEAETRAIKNAQTKMQEAQVAIANGRKLIEEARADSAQRVINASGRAASVLIEAKAEAEAIKIKQKEISSVYNDYIRAKTWDGRLPSTILGSGSSTMFNIK